MIIKTYSDEETKRAQWLRGAARKRDWVTDCTIIPFGIESVYVTIEEAEDGPIKLDIHGREESNVVAVICEREGGSPDKVLFEDTEEAWEYARLVAKEAGLPEDAVDGDVYEVDSIEDESDESVEMLKKRLEAAELFIASIDETEAYEKFLVEESVPKDQESLELS